MEDITTPETQPTRALDPPHEDIAVKAFDLWQQFTERCPDEPEPPSEHFWYEALNDLRREQKPFPGL